MNKILEGAKEALAFVNGEVPAARIHAAVGGPYYKDSVCPIVQYEVGGHWIVWNWDTKRWDKSMTRVELIAVS